MKEPIKRGSSCEIPATDINIMKSKRDQDAIQDKSLRKYRRVITPKITWLHLEKAEGRMILIEGRLTPCQ